MATGDQMEQSTSTPSISIRQWLRWLPDGVEEEKTSTLVLTTSRNNYVDTRLILHDDIKDVSIVPSASEPPVFDLSHLHWAFAGTSFSTFRTRRSSSNASKTNIKPLTPAEDKDKKETQSMHTRSASGGKVIRIRDCTWTHWVDSRGPISKHTHSDSMATRGTQPPPSPTTPEDWQDSGTIYPTDKANESLEKGRMYNDGKLQDVEELWRDFKPQVIPGESQVFSIVLTAENKILGTKGMVIRIGGWCQGIIRASNGEIGVERWRCTVGGVREGLIKRYDDSSAHEPAGASWQKIFKLGKMSLPCESACLRSYDLKEGESVTHGGLKWTVIEKELV